MWNYVIRVVCCIGRKRSKIASPPLVNMLPAWRAGFALLTRLFPLACVHPPACTHPLALACTRAHNHTHPPTKAMSAVAAIILTELIAAAARVVQVTLEAPPAKTFRTRSLATGRMQQTTNIGLKITYGCLLPSRLEST